MSVKLPINVTGDIPHSRRTAFSFLFKATSATEHCTNYHSEGTIKLNSWTDNFVKVGLLWLMVQYVREREGEIEREKMA